MIGIVEGLMIRDDAVQLTVKLPRPTDYTAEEIRAYWHAIESLCPPGRAIDVRVPMFGESEGGV